MSFALTITRLEKVTVPICRLFAALGGICLVFMTAMTVIDVAGRNLFSMPLRGTLEMVSVGMVLVFFCGMPYMEARNSHIRVDLFTEKMSASRRKSLSLGMTWLYLLIIGILCWQCFEQGLFLHVRNSNTGMMAIPLAPFMFVAAAAFALYAVMVFINLLKRLEEFLADPRKNWIMALAVFALNTALMALGLFPELAPFILSDTATGLVSLALLFLGIFLGLPIGASMVLACLVGMSHLMLAEASLSLLGMISKTVTSNYSWSVAPLFIFMGVLVAASGFSREIFDTAYKWLGHLKGGLASATIGACSLFAAVVGDSLSGVVTMGSIALPQMKKYNYDVKLSTGCVAVGGTLGILIPPSMGFIVYGLITEQSIGKLFMAGLVPGILVTLMMIALISFRCKRNPSLGPAGERSCWNERFWYTLKSWHVFCLLTIVLGGIWLGLFTPTEAGAIGAAATLFIGFGLRRFSLKAFSSASTEAVRITSSIFFIFIYATAFTQYIAVTMLPSLLASSVAALPIGRYGIFAIIVLIYLLLGCVMNALPVIILTLPILYPTVVALGFDPIWFGVIVVILAELGQITPPIGMSVFALRNVAPGVPMYTIFAGTIHFWALFILLILILTIFPQIALFLPNILY